MKIEPPPTLWCVRGLSILSGLSDPALQALAGASVTRQVSRGTILHTPGTDAEHVYCLHGGHVSALWESRAGRTINVGDFSPGDIFGEACLWTSSATREDMAITTSPALVTLVPRAVFRDVLDQHAAVERAIVAQSVSRRQAVTLRLCDAHSLDARARIAGQLLRLAEASRATADGRKVTLGPQRELAERVVCTRETVTLELARLEREGLIVRAGRRQFIVPNLNRLRAAAQESPPPKPPSSASSGVSTSFASASAP
ncbi:Crp/Fnr family transcriptional regulator [Nannocystis pusilla]|uniref:Crp/Fnr family transcriptional regulator n=1 Tax=Nannocystis pusilla TaxID=889268 RepID=A0ABS7TN37_9BACT|nr:Crp/Fnr family transcriptional regulator [Nannocystis pusilla]MBZ5709641.1 Crp/Fnr family transcriptional regulator [Nannocystis pusilla]